MAAKFLSPACLSSFITLPSQSKPRSHFRCIHQEPWLRQGRASRPRRPVVCLSLHDPLSSSTPAELFSVAETVGYSLASYYTSLGLFVISVPGLWSLIKRSVKSKVNQTPTAYALGFFSFSFHCLVWAEAFSWNFISSIQKVEN